MNEEQLTPKQKEWLEASRLIGTHGALTASERQNLQRIYDEMTPEEQAELEQYITLKAATTIPTGDPTEAMAKREWRPPSEGLKNALTRTLKTKTPPFGKTS